MNQERSLNIIFAMLSEGGHYTGTFRLAHSLQERGHRVFYLGIPDFAGLVQAQGFEFIPFASDILPEGYIGKFASSQSHPEPGLLCRLRKRLSDEAFFRAYLHRIMDGPLDECLRSCNPDLLLADTFVWYAALRGLHLGIPTLSISVILSLFPNRLIPPIIFGIHSYEAWWSTIFIRTSWVWMRVKFFFTKRLASLFFGWYRFPTRMHHLVNVFKHIARRSGYKLSENKTWWFGEMGPRLVLPEIVLCPRTFQFSRTPEDGRHYMGDFVDLKRDEEPLTSGILDEGKPLVYCSLGSSPFLYPHATRFFSAVLEACAFRQDWQFVLHTGDYPEAERLANPQSNLILRKRVPQLALLSKTSVMVTHGGLNSIMECIHFGVPMVIIPAMRDQPGNAVRALYHGIALTAPMCSITASGLIDLVRQAMGNSEIIRNLARLKQEIEAEGGLEACVQVIEEAACNRRSGS